MKLYTRAIVILAILFFSLTRICHGYVMPAEQLLEFMEKNFSGFETLVITQSSQQKDLRDQEWGEVFREQIWMKSPGLYHSEILDGTQITRTSMPDIEYHQLLIANNEKSLAELLTNMGISLERVGYTRVDGIVAYRIGDDGPESPKLVIEKERFLPLFLKYRPPADFSTKLITVQFKKYRKLEQGWYPFEMVYFVEDEILEKYTIHTVLANVPIDPTLFQTLEAKPSLKAPPEKGLSPEEEERLRRLIEVFEKKYQ